MIGTKNMNEKEKEDHAENNMYRPSLGQAYRPWLRLISREGHCTEQREPLKCYRLDEQTGTNMVRKHITHAS